MQRRQFLSRVSMTAACTLAASSQVRAAAPRRVVDTHTHFYDPGRKQGVPWPSKDSPLYRAVSPNDWLEVAAPHGARETVVVEASPWLEDKQWLLDLAKAGSSARRSCSICSAGRSEELTAEARRARRRTQRNA
ncbi:MAG: hypothetical protein ACTHK7_09500 [Aureliella sp.]